MPKIAVKNLVVTYQTRKTTNTVISDLSVAFPSNKISVIIGESGSGKSTLIKIIAGVLPLNAGEVYFDDAVVTYLPPRERDISYVNQDLVLYPKKNVFHNIAFPLEVASIPVEEIKQRVYETAEVFGLTPLLTRKIKELSLGQAQKVLLAKAMVKKPSLYLFQYRWIWHARHPIGRRGQPNIRLLPYTFFRFVSNPHAKFFLSS